MEKLIKKFFLRAEKEKKKTVQKFTSFAAFDAAKLLCDTRIQREKSVAFACFSRLRFIRVEIEIFIRPGFHCYTFFKVYCSPRGVSWWPCMKDILRRK